MRISDNTRTLLRLMLAHYDGGAAADVARCFCPPARKLGASNESSASLNNSSSHPICSLEETRHLYLDDLWVWTRFMHWNIDPSVQPLLKPLPPLSHGWIAETLGQADQGANAPGGHLFRCNRLSTYRRTVCANASDFVSPFEVNWVFTHHMAQGKGDYSIALRDDPQGLKLPPHMRMPKIRCR